MLLWSVAILAQDLLTKDMWYLDLFLTSGASSYSSPMLEVLSAVTGEQIAVFEDDELADASVKGLKQRLAQKLGIPRFRLRLLQHNCPLDDNETLIDDQTLTHQVVQLVILEFLPPDREEDKGMIVMACATNDDNLLEQHLNQPRNPNVEDAHTMTPLCAAALTGSLKCISLLIEANAKIDQGRTNNGATALYMAAQNGHLEVVRFLIESGANKDQGTTDAGATPLHHAAQNGHLEVVRVLVEFGANKDQGTTDDGRTALYIAAQSGHLEVVRFLIESGANKDHGTTDDGATPLLVAALNGHLEIVRFLIESGANKDHGTTDAGATPLFVAAHEGHLEVVRFLVESGANKDQGTTHDGATPLHVAAQNGHLEVVRFLVESGANKDQGTTDDEATPLSWSCPISGWVWCQQRPRHHRWWINVSFHSSSEWSPWSCPSSGWVWCQQRPRHHRWWSNAFVLKLSDFWLSLVPTKTKAPQMMEQQLFTKQLRLVTLKLCDF